MRQLFQNLISNALKYGRPGIAPEVTVSAQNIDPTKIAVIVKDNGVGFEVGDETKIFQLFQRLPGAGKKEGSGVGLALCKKIVQNHGGSIHVQSVPDAGTTFTITLPIKHT